MDHVQNIQARRMAFGATVRAGHRDGGGGGGILYVPGFEDVTAVGAAEPDFTS